MTRLWPKREPLRRFTAFLEDGTQFEFEARFGLAWAKAVKLAHGVRVRRIEGIRFRYTEERL